MSDSEHIAVGRDGELIAEKFLRAKGFRAIARNWRPRGKSGGIELDIIGNWNGYLVFVEVKTRRPAPSESREFPAGLKNFSPAKQRNMVLAANAYLCENGSWDTPCRFDLVCVTFLPGNDTLVEHYSNVIELGNTLDSGNASWQPW